jgi:hypothetical protein
MDLHAFLNPPCEFREVPFWSWNDRLDPLELRRQVKLIEEGGWGGFFIHSRLGLQTPYLQPDWFSCVRTSIDEARARGLQVWLYDEDKWPSGYAGGLSVAANPAYRAKSLVCKVDDRPNLLAERIATFATREVNGVLQEFRFDPAPTFCASEDRVVQFYPLTASLGNPTFNDYTYVDLLNADAVRAFLESTHEVYARHHAAEFGQAIRAIFTDEPCFQFHSYVFGEFGWQATDLALPWTQDLPECFHAQHGYDLLPHLPSLFFDCGEYRAVRYDFYRTVTGLFIQRYTQQVSDWCESHGLKFTGHVMGEDTLLWQIPWVGSAMPHMARMHIPGVDKLGRSVNGFDSGMVLTMKQLDSIVCQTGKERALCENYGCAGQAFAHTGRKWIGDWAYVLGVNLNNPHLALYSMRGERKRDCPPNLFFQQPWWPENRFIADYFARLSYALSQGQRQVDLLVIHPIGSAWTEYRPGAAAGVIKLDRALNNLLLQLMQSQRDFQLGDESLMEPGGPCAAHVELNAGVPQLAVGQMAYRVVIVPPAITLSKNTVRLLKEFSAAGGQVFALEPRPTLIDGRPADTSVLPDNTIIVSCEKLPAVLDQYLPFEIRVIDQPTIWAHQREIDGRQVYFLANIDPDRACHATVQVRGHGRAERWDAASGAVSDLPVRVMSDLMQFEFDFPPAGSILFALDPEQPPILADIAATPTQTQIVLDNRWNLAPHDRNALVLDTTQIRIDGGAWSPQVHILDAQQIAVRAGTGAAFQLRFSFEIAEMIAGPIDLALETPDQFQLTINDQAVAGPQTDAWWIDPAFRLIEITRALTPGRNAIILSGCVTCATELESVYVTGDFGVTAGRLRSENHLAGQDFDRYQPGAHITAAPQISATVDARGLDLTATGFPFFAGRITLSQRVHLPIVTPTLALEIDGLQAALVHVKVNGRDAGTACWPPHRVNISEYAREGDNTIEIELVGTLRNLLGPHHLAGGDPNRTNPEQFRDQAHWTEDYILTPFGWEQVRLCW